MISQTNLSGRWETQNGTIVIVTQLACRFSAYYEKAQACRRGPVISEAQVLDSDPITTLWGRGDITGNRIEGTMAVCHYTYPTDSSADEWHWTTAPMRLTISPSRDRITGTWADSDAGIDQAIHLVRSDEPETRALARLLTNNPQVTALDAHSAPGHQGRDGATASEVLHDVAASRP